MNNSIINISMQDTVVSIFLFLSLMPKRIDFISTKYCKSKSDSPLILIKTLSYQNFKEKNF